MAKNMARIENGVVVNIEWRSDKEPETDVLKSYSDRMICIGDSYFDGKFYRDVEEVPTDLEAAQKEIDSLRVQSTELMTVMAQMVEDVYNQDSEVFQE